MGENVIIAFNIFHHSNHLICYTGHFGDNKKVSIVSVAICVRSYHLKIVLRRAASMATQFLLGNVLTTVQWAQLGHDDLSKKITTKLTTQPMLPHIHHVHMFIGASYVSWWQVNQYLSGVDVWVDAIRHWSAWHIVANILSLLNRTDPFQVVSVFTCLFQVVSVRTDTSCPSCILLESYWFVSFAGLFALDRTTFRIISC